MQSGLQAALTAQLLRTKQFLPGLKWRVITDTSANFLIQYSVNGGTWVTEFTLSSAGALTIASGIRFGVISGTIDTLSGNAIAIGGTQGAMLGNGFLELGANNDVRIYRVAAKVPGIGSGANNLLGWNFLWNGQSRVATQFDVATSTTLANITGLTATVTAGRTYNFRAVLHIAADAVGGIKFAMAGTATATAIIYQINAIANTSNANVITSRQTALGGSAGTAADTSYFAEIEGTITVNAAGTLTAQFSQNVASGTSSVMVGSSLTVFDVP